MLLLARPRTLFFFFSCLESISFQSARVYIRNLNIDMDDKSSTFNQCIFDILFVRCSHEIVPCLSINIFLLEYFSRTSKERERKKPHSFSFFPLSLTRSPDPCREKKKKKKDVIFLIEGKALRIVGIVYIEQT